MISAGIYSQTRCQSSNKFKKSLVWSGACRSYQNEIKLEVPLVCKVAILDSLMKKKLGDGWIFNIEWCSSELGTTRICKNLIINWDEDFFKLKKGGVSLASYLYVKSYNLENIILSYCIKLHYWRSSGKKKLW